eukprot:6461557-Pyramimonas_sp.AAC.1
MNAPSASAPPCTVSTPKFGGDIGAWTADHTAFWDTAVKGSSALRAAFVRELYHECARHEGAISGAIHWDLTKLFDT